MERPRARRSEGTPVTPTVRTALAVVAAALSLVIVAGCGGDPEQGASDPTTSPTTTDPGDGGSGGVMPTTSAAERPGPPDIDPCGLVTAADVEGLGPGQRTDDELDLDPTIGSVSCRWPVGDASLTLVVETPAFSDVFENAAADPTAEDPAAIDALGDQAAYADILGGGDGTANWLLVRSGEVVVRLAGTDRSVIGQDALVAVGRSVIERVGR